MYLPCISRASPLYLVQVMTGMREISPRLSKYLTTWDRYKHIWDVDKDAFMRRYAKANRALGAFETDITRYKELQQDIQSEEGITTLNLTLALTLTLTLTLTRANPHPNTNPTPN